MHCWSDYTGGANVLILLLLLFYHFEVSLDLLYYTRLPLF